MSSLLRPLASRTAARPQSLLPSTQSAVLPFLAPSFAVTRNASGISIGNKDKNKLEKLKKKRKISKTYDRGNIKEAETFSLLDAMRYLRAFEVGRDPKSTKYEIYVIFRTFKNSPVVRGALRMPNVIDSATKIAVIAPPGSDAAQAALAAGASIVGQEDLIEKIQAGETDFQALFLHPDSEPVFRKANLGKILGPKGLMPNSKTKTIVKDVAKSIKERIGAIEYRERDGIIRLAIGQVGFTPPQLEQNIKAVMSKVKEQASAINSTIQKELHEVILSSSHGPGLPLNGSYASDESLSPQMLSSKN